MESRNFWKWHTAKRFLAVLNLKPSNCWTRITFGGKLQKHTKNHVFLTPESMVEWLSHVLQTKIKAVFAVGIKSFLKQKREKMQETIKWKYSNAGKIQNFTFWASAKIHPYCLRILKSPGDHNCLKFWKFGFDLRKKKKFLQIRQQKRVFGNSEPQKVNLLNLGKFSKDCSTRKKRKPWKK